MVALLIGLLLLLLGAITWRKMHDRQQWLRFRIRVASPERFEQLELPLLRLLRRLAPAELWFVREGASWAMVVALPRHHERELRATVLAHAPQSYVARVTHFDVPARPSGLFTMARGAPIDTYTDTAAVMIFRSSHSHGAWIAIEPRTTWAIPCPRRWQQHLIEAACVWRWSRKPPPPTTFRVTAYEGLVIPQLPVIVPHLPSIVGPALVLGQRNDHDPVTIPIHPFQRVNLIGDHEHVRPWLYDLITHAVQSRAGIMLSLRKETADLWLDQIDQQVRQRVRIIDPFNLSTTTTIDIAHGEKDKIATLIMRWSKLASNDSAVAILRPAIEAWMKEDAAPRHLAALLARLFDPPQALCALANYAGIDRRVAGSRWQMRLRHLVVPEVMGCFAAPGDDLTDFLAWGGIVLCIQPDTDRLQSVFDHAFDFVATTAAPARPIIMFNEQRTTPPDASTPWMHLWTSHQPLTNDAWHLIAGGTTAKLSGYHRYGIHASSVVGLTNQALVLHPQTDFITVLDRAQRHLKNGLHTIPSDEMVCHDQTAMLIAPAHQPTLDQASLERNMAWFVPIIRGLTLIHDYGHRQYGLTAAIHRLTVHTATTATMHFQQVVTDTDQQTWITHPSITHGEWRTPSDLYAELTDIQQFPTAFLPLMEQGTWSVWLWDTIHHLLITHATDTLIRWVVFHALMHQHDMRVTCLGDLPTSLSWIQDYHGWFTVPTAEHRLEREQWERWGTELIRVTEPSQPPIFVIIALKAGEQPAVVFEILVHLFRRSIAPHIKLYLCIIAPDAHASLIQLDGIIPRLDGNPIQLQLHIPTYVPYAVDPPPVIDDVTVVQHLQDAMADHALRPTTGDPESIHLSASDFWGVAPEELAPSFDDVFPLDRGSPMPDQHLAQDALVVHQPDQHQVVHDPTWLESFVRTAISYRDRIGTKYMMTTYPDLCADRSTAEEALQTIAGYLGDILVNAGQPGVYRIRQGATLEWALAHLQHRHHAPEIVP